MVTDIAPKTGDENEHGSGHPIVNIDPDFSMPTGGHRQGSYLRAWRILFPKNS